MPFAVCTESNADVVPHVRLGLGGLFEWGLFDSGLWALGTVRLGADCSTVRLFDCSTVRLFDFARSEI